MKGILAAGTETDGHDDRESNTGGRVGAATSAPAHLHGPDRLFDVEATS